MAAAPCEALFHQAGFLHAFGAATAHYASLVGGSGHFSFAPT